MFTYISSSRGHDRFRSSGHLHPLEDEEMRLIAPSVFASNPMPGVSESYAFMPTIQAVDAMRKEGWQPVWVSEQKVRLDSRRGFQKHMIRFQRADQLAVETDFRPKFAWSILTTAAVFTSFMPVCSGWSVETGRSLLMKHLSASAFVMLALLRPRLLRAVLKSWTRCLN